MILPVYKTSYGASHFHNNSGNTDASSSARQVGGACRATLSVSGISGLIPSSRRSNTLVSQQKSSSALIWPKIILIYCTPGDAASLAAPVDDNVAARGSAAPVVDVPTASASAAAATPDVDVLAAALASADQLLLILSRVLLFLLPHMIMMMMMIMSLLLLRLLIILSRMLPVLLSQLLTMLSLLLL